MNERMAHFLTAPYMSIYYNAGSGDPSAAVAAAAARTEGETGRAKQRLFSFVYFLLFKAEVKVNAARRKKFLPRAQLLISRYQI